MLNSHATWIRRTIDHLIIRNSRNETIDGLWVGAFVDRSEWARIFAQLRAALELIKSYDPHRYKRVLARFDKILVLYIPSRGQFIPELRRCVLDADFVIKATPEQIAATIIHEATHGELIRRGIGYDRGILHRVEAVCTRQELAFAARIPKSDKVVERAEIKLELPAGTWSEEASVTRSIRWLKDGGWPNWMLRALETAYRWKRKRAEKRAEIKRSE